VFYLPLASIQETKSCLYNRFFEQCLMSLKKPVVKPSTPGDLFGVIENKAFLHVCLKESTVQLIIHLCGNFPLNELTH
jgi:hypothetical protein